MRKLNQLELLQFEHPDIFNKYWEVFYIDSDEIVHVHRTQNHFVRVARAIDRDHVWYGLPHIGRLSPVDTRYTGADRRPFDSYPEARAWAYEVMETHPNGLMKDELQETQLHYCWDSDQEFSIDSE